MRSARLLYVVDSLLVLDGPEDFRERFQSSNGKRRTYSIDSNTFLFTHLNVIIDSPLASQKYKITD